MVKAQCLWDVAIKIAQLMLHVIVMGSFKHKLVILLQPGYLHRPLLSINVLVANLKPLYWVLWPRKINFGS